MMSAKHRAKRPTTPRRNTPIAALLLSLAAVFGLVPGYIATASNVELDRAKSVLTAPAVDDSVETANSTAPADQHVAEVPPVVQSPVVSDTAPVAATAATYKVVADDWLSTIAPKFGSTTAELIQLNPQIADPDVIFVGQAINVPPDGNVTTRQSLETQLVAFTVSDSSAPVTAAPTHPEPIAVVGTVVAPAPTEYTVVSGDILSDIATRFGMTTDHLWSLNTNVIAWKHDIMPGMVLKLTGTPQSLPAPPVVAEPAPAAPAPTHSHDAAPSVPSGSGKGATAVAYALAQVGKWYEYGASLTSDRFDCSSLTLRAWASAGVSLPRVSSAQLSAFPRVSMSDLQPGDLIGRPGHVAMYIGGGNIVHAYKTGQPVSIDSLDGFWGSDLTTAVRPG